MRYNSIDVPIYVATDVALETRNSAQKSAVSLPIHLYLFFPYKCHIVLRYIPMIHLKNIYYVD